MRFDLTPKLSEGDKRVVRKFLFFPISIDNEMRWLERATVEYTLDYVRDPTTGGHWNWRASKFLNK